MYPPNESCHRAPTKSNRGLIAGSLLLGVLSVSAYGQTSFTHTIDFGGYQHGSIVEPGAYSGLQYVSPILNVTPPEGGYDKAVIFNTQDPNVPGNRDVEDQDLIPKGLGNVGREDFGNVAIIQENTDFTIKDGRIVDPYKKIDDHASGGTFSFDLNPDRGVTIDSFRIDLIDIEKDIQIRIVAYDSKGSFTWTGEHLKRLDSSISFGDASANRTSILSASYAGLEEITRVDIISGTSFAIDNFTFQGTMIPEVSSGFLTASSALLLCFRRRRQA